MVALSLSPGYHITLLVGLIKAGRDFTFSCHGGNSLTIYPLAQGMWVFIILGKDLKYCPSRSYIFLDGFNVLTYSF